MRGCSGRPHGYMALPVPAMPCRDGFCFPRRKQGRKGTSTRRAAEVFPCHFQAQEAPLHGAVLHGLRIPEFGRRFSGGFHFPQGSPVNQVRGDFHFMLYLRRLRIYRPPQHQMPASFNAFFHGYLRHASAGFQRVQARGVFHQVGDAVPGGSGIRSRPVRRGVRREGVLHPLVIARQVSPGLRDGDGAFLLVGSAEHHRSGPSGGRFVFRRRQDDRGPADAGSGGNGNPFRGVRHHPAQGFLFHLNFHIHRPSCGGNGRDKPNGEAVTGNDVEDT